MLVKVPLNSSLGVTRHSFDCLTILLKVFIWTTHERIHLVAFGQQNRVYLLLCLEVILSPSLMELRIKWYLCHFYTHLGQFDYVYEWDATQSSSGKCFSSKFLSKKKEEEKCRFSQVNEGICL